MELNTTYLQPLAIGVFLLILSLVCIRWYFSRVFAKQLKEYEAEILKSHSKILQLEQLNHQLEQELDDLKGILHTRIAV